MPLNAILFESDNAIAKWGIAIKKEFIKYRIFMFAYWAMMLSVTGMYTMYIINIGFSKTEIGIAVTISAFSGLLGQNFIGFLADRFKCVRKILLFSISTGIIVAAGLMFAKHNWHVFIALALWAFFVYGTVPLSEAWCIGLLKAGNEQNNFGKIRGVGSVGYGLSGVLMGLILQNIGWSIYYWCILVSVIFAMISVLMLTEIKGVAFYKGSGKGAGENGNISFKEAFKETIKIKPLRSIIIIVFMYSFVMKGIYSYLGILVSDFGGGPLSLGFTYFFDATPEVVTFFLTARLMSKYHNKWLILAAFILQIIRLSFILVFNNSLSIILLGILSGFAYGLIATAYKTYIYELAPEKYKISCLSLSESIIGLSGVISVPVFGFVLIKFGGFAAISAGLAIDVIALGIILKDIYKAKVNRPLSG